MAFTRLGDLLPEQKKLWQQEAIKTYQEKLFFTPYMGKGDNSIVQVVTAFDKDKAGKAGIGLVPDLQNFGVVGDNKMEDREEALDSSWAEIRVDQIRQANRTKGRMQDQRSVFDFREQSKTKLGIWRANIMEELMVLTASGISYRYNTNGSLRANNGQDDPNDLEFAASVTAPSSNRHFIVNSSGNFVNDSNSAITSASVMTYNTLVDFRAEAKTRGIKPIIVGGKEYHVFFCHNKVHAQLLKDAAFREAIVKGRLRGEDNPIFSGADVTMDGLIIASNQRAFNTLGAAAGSKWGSGGNVNGTRSLLLGAQSLAVADIWGQAKWVEKDTDYENRWGVAIAMMIGVLKPQFKSKYDDNTVQDFGVMALDSYIQ